VQNVQKLIQTILEELEAQWPDIRRVSRRIQPSNPADISDRISSARRYQPQHPLKYDTPSQNMIPIALETARCLNTLH
jgi:hypothetical protein